MNYTLDLNNINDSEINYSILTFPGGEPHIKLDLNGISADSEVDIHMLVRNSNEFMILCMAISALKSSGISCINLFIPYFPGARQDRISQNGEALSVKVYAQIINSFNLNSVTVTNPHSDVTTALLDNCFVYQDFDDVADIILQITEAGEEFVIISPDAGALKKTHQLAKYLKNDYSFLNFEIVECSKVRNTTTGKLSGFNIKSDDLNGKTCIIVDDICDGGGTFLGIAAELNKLNAGNLHLYTTHGIYSNNAIDRLLESFVSIDCLHDFTENKVWEI